MHVLQQSHLCIVINRKFLQELPCVFIHNSLVSDQKGSFFIFNAELTQCLIKIGFTSCGMERTLGAFPEELAMALQNEATSVS
jgi:hypothetical protein